MKSIAIRSPNSSPAMRVNRLMMEHAPSMASKNSRMAVHTQTLHTYMAPKKKNQLKQCHNCTQPIRNKILSQCRKDDLPTGPGQEQIPSEVGPVLGKVEHECVHEHSGFGNSQYQQGLPSHNGVDYAAHGSGCQRLHCCEDSICIPKTNKLLSSATVLKLTPPSTNFESPIYQCSSPIAPRTISPVSRTRRICKWSAPGS